MGVARWCGGAEVPGRKKSGKPEPRSERGGRLSLRQFRRNEYQNPFTSTPASDVDDAERGREGVPGSFRRGEYKARRIVEEGVEGGDWC